MLNFPQELVDHTLDNVVVGDHRGETLKNCALVASNWTSRSQKHLFSTVYTSNVRQTERLSSVLGGRPHLSNYIHVLEICFENDLGSSHGSAFRSHSKVLVPILVSCRHIEKLVLFCGQTAFSRPFTEFYLPAWFIAMLVGVLSMSSSLFHFNEFIRIYRSRPDQASGTSQLGFCTYRHHSFGCKDSSIGIEVLPIWVPYRQSFLAIWSTDSDV
jgi:hypothetical protein